MDVKHKFVNDQIILKLSKVVKDVNSKNFAL